MKQQPPFYPGDVFHIYNRANGSDNLFEEHENYMYFQRKYIEKVSELVDTLAFCLMPNHFHLLVKVKSQEVINDYILRQRVLKDSPVTPPDLTDFQRTHFIVRRQFHGFFCGYAKAFNRYTGRKGSLLQQNTRRKIVSDDEYLKTLAQYIHLNPVHHGFVSDAEAWKYSSYADYVSGAESFVKTKQLIQVYGNLDELVKKHRQHQKIMVILRSP
jgi:putative transposase